MILQHGNEELLKEEYEATIPDVDELFYENKRMDGFDQSFLSFGMRGVCSSTNPH